MKNNDIPSELWKLKNEVFRTPQTGFEATEKLNLSNQHLIDALHLLESIKENGLSETNQNRLNKFINQFT